MRKACRCRRRTRHPGPPGLPGVCVRGARLASAAERLAPCRPEAQAPRMSWQAARRPGPEKPPDCHFPYPPGSLSKGRSSSWPRSPQGAPPGAQSDRAIVFRARSTDCRSNSPAPASSGPRALAEDLHGRFVPHQLRRAPTTSEIHSLWPQPRKALARDR